MDWQLRSSLVRAGGRGEEEGRAFLHLLIEGLQKEMGLASASVHQPQDRDHWHRSQGSCKAGSCLGLKRSRELKMVLVVKPSAQDGENYVC